MESLLRLMQAIEELVNPLGIDRDAAPSVEVSFSPRKKEYVLHFRWPSPASKDAAREIVSAHHADLLEATQLAHDSLRDVARALIEQSTKAANQLIEIARP